MLSNVTTIKVENVFTLINNRNMINKINKYLFIFTNERTKIQLGYV